MRNLLITGGCGFIGSNYINYIFKKYNDFNIINIDAMYYCASEKNIEEEINKHNESYKKLIDYKYDSKCKYCIENSITKQKVFLEKSINENNCKINKYKDELNIIEKILKKQESIKNQYDKYIEDIEKVNDVFEAIAETLPM